MNRKRFLATTLALLMCGSLVTPAISAGTVEYQDSTEGTSCEVIYTQDSNFEVIIPKKITLDITKESSYYVDVNGDFSGEEKVVVVPEANFLMSDVSGGTTKKDDVTATVTQDKMQWLYNEVDIDGNGLVSAPDLTSGSWHGTFWFNIKVNKTSKDIIIDITDENGDSVDIITDIKTGDDIKQELEDLGTSGIIGKEDNILGIIDITKPGSDESEDINISIDIGNIVEDGDKLNIYEHDDIYNEWEYVGTETVEDGKIDTTVDSDSTIAITATDTGLFDTEYNQIKTWEELLAEGSITITNGTLTKVNPAAINGILIMDDGVSAIGNNAFEGCAGLIDIVFSNGVTSLGDYAFKECTNLKRIYFPKTILTMGNYVYYKCSNVAYINVASENPNYASFNGILYTKDMKQLILCPNGKTNANVIIPNTVERIGYSGFSLCTGVVSITIPDSVKVIETKAFKNCTGLESLTIPETVEQIDADAFYGVKHVYYKGNAAGAPWGALALN